jgi:transposase-like protein
MAAKAKQVPRQFSEKFKRRAVERMRAGEGGTSLARELGVRRKLLYEWRDRALVGEPFRQAGRPRKTSEQRQSEQREHYERLIAEMERKIGHQQLVIDFFKGALRQIEESRQANSGSGGTASSGRSRK